MTISRAFHAERTYIRKAVEQRKPVFGICLGAQMLSLALGGTVEPSGRVPVRPAQDRRHQPGFHRPGLRCGQGPSRAYASRRLFFHPGGWGEAGEGIHAVPRDGGFRKINMAFRYGNSYGFQFEPQLTRGRVVRLEPGNAPAITSLWAAGSTPRRKPRATCVSSPSTRPTIWNRWKRC